MKTLKVSNDMKESHGLQLLHLPVDVVLYGIASFLRRTGQYSLFSTSKAWNIPLYHCRSMSITCTTRNSHNSMIWDMFQQAGKRERLFGILGLPTSSSPSDALCAGGCRKFRIQLSIDELYTHKDWLLPLMNMCYLLQVYEPTSLLFHYPSISLPLAVNNPTEASVTRLLQSVWIPVQDTNLQDLHIHLQNTLLHIGTEEVEQNTEIPVCTSLQDLRGIQQIVFNAEGHCFVELAANLHNRLQRVQLDQVSNVFHMNALQGIVQVSLHHCNNVCNIDCLSEVRVITIEACPHVYDVSALAHADYVSLKDMQVTDLSMLAKVSKLVLCRCKAEKFPTPAMGKGQDWEFESMELADVSSLALLESLALIRCLFVQDISMLGAVKYLTIESCDGLDSYPRPTGRFQEWSFIHMKIVIDMQQFRQLYKLIARHCPFKQAWTITHCPPCLHIHHCMLPNISKPVSVVQIDGKGYLNDQNLRPAVALWCHHEAEARSIYGDISCWDVSAVEDMDYLFRKKYAFNSDINNWDVSRVRCMRGMFYQAHAFNKPIHSWNVSNVTDMSFMFEIACCFNQPINSWDTRNVRLISNMFQYATAFNQPIGNWNMSNVVNIDEMFFEAANFNQSLQGWDVSNVSSMRGTFRSAKAFNQPLDRWDVSQVKYMGCMFREAIDFNQPLTAEVAQPSYGVFATWFRLGSTNKVDPPSTWDVRNVHSMNHMFFDATSFNQPLGMWQVDAVRDMHGMFSGATAFNQPLDSWNIDDGTDISNMFLLASSYKYPPLTPASRRIEASVNL